MPICFLIPKYHCRNRLLDALKASDIRRIPPGRLSPNRSFSQISDPVSREFRKGDRPFGGAADRFNNLPIFLNLPTSNGHRIAISYDEVWRGDDSDSAPKIKAHRTDLPRPLSGGKPDLKRAVISESTIRPTGNPMGEKNDKTGNGRKNDKW